MLQTSQNDMNRKAKKTFLWLADSSLLHDCVCTYIFYWAQLLARQSLQCKDGLSSPQASHF